jgi:hypothetical protein
MEIGTYFVGTQKKSGPERNKGTKNFRKLQIERLTNFYSSHEMFNVTKCDIGWVEHFGTHGVKSLLENPRSKVEDNLGREWMLKTMKNRCRRNRMYRC